MILSFLQNEFVRALCWTLIHSLWQGLLLAAATGLVMVLTRKSHANKRYSILSGLFFLFIAVAVITFCRELNLSRSSGTLAAVTTVSPINAGDINNIIITDTLSGAVKEQTMLQRFVAYFNANAAMIVLVWFIIFFAKFLRLSANIVYVQRLKSYKVYDPADEWKEKMAALMSKLGVSKKVKLVESGIIKVPLTMGMLKPVILLPLGLLSQLPADEIEAILLHELAHIRRRDYFVNLLQSIAETVFFFNPALLWLSSVIRDERENCCDDLAISVTNNKTNFINALISFQEYHLAKPGYGMAFPGNRNQLLNRVKRIVSNRNKTLNAAEKSVLSLGLIIFAMLFFVAAKTVQPLQNKQDQGDKKNKTEKLSTQKNSTLGKSIQEIKSSEAIKKEKARADLLRNDTLFMEDMEGTETGIAKTSGGDFAKLFSDGQAMGRMSMLKSMANLDALKQTLTSLSTDKSNSFLGNMSSLGQMDPLGPLMTTLNDLQDTLPSFKSFSSDINDDGKMRIVKLTVVTTAGKEMYFKKTDGVLQELTINGKKIPESEFDSYKEEVAIVEEAYTRRMVLKKIKLDHQRELRDHNRNMRKDELDKIKGERLHELKERGHKKLDSTQNRIKGNMNKLFENRKLDLLRGQKLKIDKSIALAPSADVMLKDNKLSLAKPIKMDMKYEVIGDKIKDADVPINIKLKPKGEEKPVPDKFREEKKSSKNSFLKTDEKGNVTWGRDDAAYREYMDNEKKKTKSGDGLPLGKREAIRAMQQEDEARKAASANTIRSIIEDLGKENIKVDLQKSWLALDKDRFIVDGKPMSEEMHNRFRLKYVKDTDGMGWYYGPVKLTGRGVFLDKKDLQTK